MPLSDIVNVVITRQTQSVSERGFGIPLILGTHKRFNDFLRYYSDMAEVSVDFDSSDKEYIAAQDIFSQEISPERIAIGRRQVDDVNIELLTPMAGQVYTVRVNNDSVSTVSLPATPYSVVDLDNDLFANNKIFVRLNNENVGLIRSRIEFDDDFGAGSSIVVTINGTPLAAVPFNTDQNTTMQDLRTVILTDSAVTGAGSVVIVNDNELLVTFNASGNNTVNSVITTGGNSPTANITQWGFDFNVDTLTTMQDIANAIEAQFPTFTAGVSGLDSRRLTVSGPSGVSAIVSAFFVFDGVDQANAIISTPLQILTAQDVVASIVADINSVPPSTDFPIIAVDNLDGTFTIQSQTPGVPYTLNLTTDIINPNLARVEITQVLPNTEYFVTINGMRFSYNSGQNIQDSEEILEGLATEIMNGNVPVDAYLTSDGELEIASLDLSQSFSVSVNPDSMAVLKGFNQLSLTPSQSVISDLDAIENSDSDWYALISTSRDQATVKSIADWVESRIKLFGTASDDLTIINSPLGTDTTSIAAVLNQSGYVRTFVMYHQDAESDFPEAAWMGRVLPLEPGSETWKFKTLNGISYSNLTSTQSKNALDKKANIYEFVAGVGITENGTVAQGEFIDIVRGIDWLTSRIQEFVFGVLVRNNKIPYTDAGIAVIQAEVMRVLSLGVANNFLSDNPQPRVTVPRASQVPTNDKANRILRNVKFEATLAGAIHAVRITGNITV